MISKRISWRKSKLGERGSIIFPFLITMAIMVGSVSLYFAPVLLAQRKQNQNLILHSNLNVYLVSIQAILNSQRSTIKSLKSNLNVNLWRCVNDVEFLCSQTNPTSMALISETGDDSNPYVDPTAGIGVTPSLDKCSSFPSTTCPFRYELKWHAECPLQTANCQAPDIFIEGILQIAQQMAGTITLNPANYYLLIKVK